MYDVNRMKDGMGAFLVRRTFLSIGRHDRSPRILL